ncbi:MAG: ABC transporter ATP-binding protein [Clostridiales bacterium]|nr:ABC transporter ATP-binding protein [Clostridiales bacterium]
MIEAVDLTYCYPGGAPALRALTFRLADGARCALMGANGAGKSTLLSLLCGLELPQGGRASIDGVPLDRAHIEQVRARVGMVFQNPDDQLFMPTVWDDVAFGLRRRGLPAAEVDARASEALADMGALHLKDRPPYRLSGGEKRAVALAAVLALRPSTLLLDEPTAFLDPRARRALVARLRALPVGLLIATHDLALAKELADEVLLLREGQLLAQGPVALLGDGRLMDRALLR